MSDLSEFFQAVYRRDPFGDYDHLHEAFVELRGKHDGTVYPGAVLRRAKQRRCDEFRRRKTQEGITDPALSDISESPDHRANEQEKRAVLREKLASLPFPLKTAIHLRFWGDMSPKQIAHVFNRSEKTIYRWLAKGCSQLSTQLSESRDDF